MMNGISVVMTTFNGEKYIKKQLESIYRQTRKPDEVLIFDDGSSDHTINIIDGFIKKYKLDTWHMELNNKNKGWKVNFWDGIAKSAGELIFLSDQDDIWHKDKIEIMTEQMDQHPNIELLASNYNAFYDTKDTKRISKRYMYHMNLDGSLKKIYFDNFFLNVQRPGCTYCFRKELFLSANKLWHKSFAHDAVLWRTAVLTGGAYILDLDLIEYRRYVESSSNVQKLMKRKQIWDKLDALYKFNLSYLKDDIKSLQLIIKQIENIEAENQAKVEFELQEIVKYMRNRILMYERKSIFRYFLVFVKYQKYYFTKKSLLGDFLVVLGERIIGGNS